MLLPGEVHWLLTLKHVLFPRAVKKALVARPSSRDEDLAGGQSAGRCIVLYFAVVDGGEGVAVGEGAESEDLLALSEETDLRSHFVTDLNEVLIAGEGHHEDWELYHCGFVVLANSHLLNRKLLLRSLLPLHLL